MPQKFEYYDAIAHLVPGTIACLLLVVMCEALGIAIPRLHLGSLSELGVGIAVAYTAGHLLQALATGLEPFYYVLWGGRPSVKLLEDKSSRFSKTQRDNLVMQLEENFRFIEEFPKDKKGIRGYYQRLFERCMALCNQNKLGRVEIFVTNYGFHRVMLTLFLSYSLSCLVVLCFAKWGSFQITPEKLGLFYTVFAISVLCALVEFFRARTRAYYYAHEVLMMTAEYFRANAGARR